MRRELFDLVGPAARARGQLGAFAVDEAGRLRRALALLGETAILIQVAQPSPEFLAYRLLKRFRENRPQVLALASPDRPVLEKDANALLARLGPRSDTLWRYAAVRFENNQFGGDVYLDAPSIATLYSTIALPAGERPVRRDRFDIVSNRVAVRVGSNAPAITVRIAQGVADSIAEQAVLPESSAGGSTADIFAAAAAQGAGPVVVRNDGTVWRGPADLAADVLARVKMDISEGYDLVMPGRTVTLAGTPRIGWWRVDRGDGTVVGVMDTGFHQGFVEYAKDTAAVVLGFVVADWVWDHVDEGRVNLRYSLIATSNVLMMISDWLRDHPVKPPEGSAPR